MKCPCAKPVATHYFIEGVIEMDQCIGQAISVMEDG